MSGGSRLRSVACLVAGSVLAACAQSPVLPETALTVGGLWRIDQAMVEPLLDRRQARLDFRPDGRMTGHAGCNQLSATYTLVGDRLALGPVISTRMACAPLQMEQEDRILTALGKAVTARVRPDGLLELRDADGKGVLRGSRFEP